MCKPSVHFLRVGGPRFTNIVRRFIFCHNVKSCLAFSSADVHISTIVRKFKKNFDVFMGPGKELSSAYYTSSTFMTRVLHLNVLSRFILVSSMEAGRAEKCGEYNGHSR